MCWSAPVSLFFGLLHTLLAYRIFKRQKQLKYGPEFLMFTSFYAIMEYLQFLQWMVGVVDIYGPIKPCSPTNVFLTCCAYLLIWTQPLLFSLIGRSSIYAGLRTYDARSFRHGIYSFSMSASWFVLFAAIINLIAGFYTSDMIYFVRSPSNFGYQTCTYLGEYGHLDWQFRVRWLDFQPTYLIYLTIIITAIWHFDPELKWILGLGWGGTFLLSYWLVGGSSEFPAYWCWLSVLADLPIFIYMLQDNSRIEA